MAASIAGDPDLQRVHLERAPAEHHLVAGRGGDLDELLAQADRTASGGNMLRSEIHVLGQALFEFDVTVVGIAVQGVGGLLDRGSHPGQRPVHGLVAGQFDRTRDGLARCIRR
jgi:hypothetical protein